MSDLPADALTYEMVVAEYFLGLRGTGLMLSPLDAEQVRAWKLRGVPVPVVCRGLRHGYERALAAVPPRVPRSLRALRLSVEDEWRAYREGRLAGEPAREDEALTAARVRAALDVVRRAAAAAPPPALAAAYARSAAALEALAARALAAEEVDAAVAAADEEALAAWLRGLDRGARDALGRFCALRAGPRARGCTRPAHRQALRAHARDFARGVGLTLLRGSV